jgi:hypothetical protein
MTAVFHPKSYALSGDPQMVAKLSRLVQGAIAEKDWKFSCDGVDLNPEEVGGEQWLLSMILWRTMDWMEEGFGERPPLGFRVDPQNLCGATAEYVGPTAPLAMWAMFVHFTLENEVRRLSPAPGESVPLDGWYARWREAMMARRVPLLPPASRPGLEQAATPTTQV